MSNIDWLIWVACFLVMLWPTMPDQDQEAGDLLEQSLIFILTLWLVDSRTTTQNQGHGNGLVLVMVVLIAATLAYMLYMFAPRIYSWTTKTTHLKGVSNE